MSYLVERTGPIFRAYFRGWQVYPTTPRWGRTAARAHEFKTLRDAETMMAEAAALGIETVFIGGEGCTIPRSKYPLHNPGP